MLDSVGWISNEVLHRHTRPRQRQFPEGADCRYGIHRHLRGFEKACESEGGLALGAHVNLKQGKAFCFTAGPDVEAIRKAHDAIGLPYDPITDVRRVTGVDLREASGIVKGAQAVG